MTETVGEALSPLRRKHKARTSFLISNKHPIQQWLIREIGRVDVGERPISGEIFAPAAGYRVRKLLSGVSLKIYYQVIELLKTMDPTFYTRRTDLKNPEDARSPLTDEEIRNLDVALQATLDEWLKATEAFKASYIEIIKSGRVPPKLTCKKGAFCDQRQTPATVRLTQRPLSVVFTPKGAPYVSACVAASCSARHAPARDGPSTLLQCGGWYVCCTGLRDACAAALGVSALAPRGYGLAAAGVRLDTPCEALARRCEVRCHL